MKKIPTVVLVCVLLSLPAWAVAPAISAIAVTQTTSTTATVIWTTDIGGTSQVAYGIGNTSSVTAVDGSLVTSHAVTVTGLRSGVVYTYAVVSQNAAGESTTSSTSTFGLCPATSSTSGFTRATGNINLAYAYGPFTATLVNDSGSANAPTVCGNAVTSPATGTIDASGNFASSLPDVNLITPSPAHWSLNVKALNGKVGSFTVSISPTGVSQDFTSSLQTGASGQLQLQYFDPATGGFDPDASLSQNVGTVLINATSKTFQGQTTGSGNVDVYTVPSGKRAIVSLFYFNPSGSSISVFTELKRSSTYTRMATTSVVTAQGTGIANSTYVFDAASSDVLAFNATATGLNWFASITEFDNTSYLKSVINTALASGDNTLYTVPATKSAYLLGNNGSNSGFTVAQSAAVTIMNGSAGSLNYKANFVLSGGSVGASNQISPSAAVGAAALATVSIQGRMSAGDFLNVNSSGAGAGQVAWTTVIEK